MKKKLASAVCITMYTIFNFAILGLINPLSNICKTIYVIFAIYLVFDFITSRHDRKVEAIKRKRARRIAEHEKFMNEYAIYRAARSK